jgi:hypothetical protein
MRERNRDIQRPLPRHGSMALLSGFELHRPGKSKSTHTVLTGCMATPPVTTSSEIKCRKVDRPAWRTVWSWALRI